MPRFTGQTIQLVVGKEVRDESRDSTPQRRAKRKYVKTSDNPRICSVCVRSSCKKGVRDWKNCEIIPTET